MQDDNRRQKWKQFFLPAHFIILCFFFYILQRFKIKDQNPKDYNSVEEYFKLIKHTVLSLQRTYLCLKSTRVLSDNANHCLIGSSFPMRNKQHEIGMEVNARSLKARGFQQVLSRNWSTQVCGSKHSSSWRPLTCAHSTCAQSGPVYFCFPSRQLAEALSKSVPQQHTSLFLSSPSLLLSLLHALFFRPLCACSVHIVVRSDVNKFPREMRAKTFRS